MLTCSTMTCAKRQENSQPTWVNKKSFPGFNCCLVDGELIPDGHSWPSVGNPLQMLELKIKKIKNNI